MNRLQVSDENISLFKPEPALAKFHFQALTPICSLELTITSYKNTMTNPWYIDLR
jgi:hypothetical protein